MSGPYTLEIPRLSNLDAQTLEGSFLRGVGQPLILTDALGGFEAMKKWDFSFFAKAYGDDVVELSDHIDSARVKTLATMREYMEYIVRPQGTRLEELTQDRSLYAFGYQAFESHPELLDDIGDPYCLDNWLSTLTPKVRAILSLMDGSPAGRWIFIGPKGTVSTFHTDYTSAWLAQIRGTKRAALVSPADSDCMYDGAVDPFDPCLERHPDFQHATVHTGLLEPGDVLLMPHGWWHYVEALTPSITCSFNFVTRQTFSRFMEELIRDVPLLCDVFDEAPQVSDALDINWQSRGFDAKGNAPSAPALVR